MRRPETPSQQQDVRTTVAAGAGARAAAAPRATAHVPTHQQHQQAAAAGLRAETALWAAEPPQVQGAVAGLELSAAGLWPLH